MCFSLASYIITFTPCQKRFEDIIGNLTHEMELKTTQLNDVEAKIEEMRDAGRRAAAGGADDDEEYEEGEVSDYSDDGEEGDEYGDNESERGHDEMEHGGGDEEVELDYGDDEYEPPQAASD